MGDGASLTGNHEPGQSSTILFRCSLERYRDNRKGLTEVL